MSRGAGQATHASGPALVTSYRAWAGVRFRELVVSSGTSSTVISTHSELLPVIAEERSEFTFGEANLVTGQ